MRVLEKKKKRRKSKVSVMTKLKKEGEEKRVLERLGGEAGEDDGVDGSDLGAGEHDHRQLGHHGHVHSHHIASAHALRGHDRRDARDLLGELRVADAPPLPWLVRLPNNRHLRTRERDEAY